MISSSGVCSSCGCRLSKYRKPREKRCAPCTRTRVDAGVTEAHSVIVFTSRGHEAFVMCWRGFSWKTIATLLKYPTHQAANAAARDYAKRNDRVLP